MYNDFTLKECRIPVCISVAAYDSGRFKYICTRVNIIQKIRLSPAIFRTLALSYCLRYLIECGAIYLNYYYHYLSVVKLLCLRSICPRFPNQISPNPRNMDRISDLYN